MFGTSLETVAGLMFLVSLLLPPLGIFWGWWTVTDESP